LTTLTETIVAGLGAPDMRPRQASWDVLSHSVPPGPLERGAIAKTTRAPGSIELFAAKDLPHADSARRAILLQLLNDACRAADKTVCSKLLDIIIVDGQADGFVALDGAPDQGLDVLFTRVRAESRAATKAGLVRALIGQTPVEREPALLAEARQL